MTGETIPAVVHASATPGVWTEPEHGAIKVTFFVRHVPVGEHRPHNAGQIPEAAQRAIRAFLFDDTKAGA